MIMKKKIAILMSVLIFAMVGCESQPITPQAPVGDTVQAEGEQEKMNGSSKSLFQRFLPIVDMKKG